MVDINIEDTLLEALSRPLARRGGVATFLLGLPLLVQYKKKTIQNAFNRLKHKDYLTFEGRTIKLSPSGRQYLMDRQVYLATFASPFSKSDKKNLIVIFDIPESKKAEREWFRRQLKNFGYEIIQRSVWYGPSPLPKAFVSYIESIGLADTIKVFKASPLSLIK